MKDVVGRVFRPPSLFRGFAAKPRATLGVDGGVAVAAFYPRALGLAVFLELIYIPYAG